MRSRLPFITILVSLGSLWMLLYQGVLAIPIEAAKTLHASFNVAESAIWILAGCWVYWPARRQGGARRAAGAVAAAAFVAFGVSDVVETQTGAWYRPWWLLTWKAACVACLVFCFVLHARLSRGQATG